MAVTNFSPLLGLALPTTGDLSGTWGATVNDSITGLIDSAVAGTTTLSADADVTLSTTNGAANQARNAVILWTASNGATTRNITAPAQSKAYVVINAGTGSIVIRGSGPTTGVTVASGFKALVAWNGSDFVKIASSLVNLTSDVTGTLPIANGGTGTTSTTFVNLATNVTGNLPTTNLNSGTSASATTFWRGDGAWAVPTGTATGSVTSVAATVPSLLSVSGSPITTSGTLAFTYSGTALPVANGGTGATTLTANNVLLGNGTSALQVVAPGTNGNVLTSNGSTWTSAAVASGLSGITQAVSPFETSLGFEAGNATTGTDNTFMGYQAGKANTSGTDNTAIGASALRDGTTTNYNTAVGRRALLVNTADGNTAIGWTALEDNTSGGSNVAVGSTSLAQNTTGGSNVGVGSQALRDNTTGLQNTGVGADAGQRTTTGVFNTSIGSSALYTNTTGEYNTSVGRSAAYYITTGTQNTVLGTSAGASGTNDLTTGSNNTIIGYNAAASAAAASNEITFGNASVTKLRIPGLSVDWDADAVPFRNIPQNSQSAAYTLVAADAGKHIFHPVGDNNARTFTIPANSSVAYPIGTAITFINMAVANVTIAITTDTLTLSPAGTTGSRTLATNGSATCIKITSTSWLISGSGLT